MKQCRLILALLVLLSAGFVDAQTIQTYESGPIHEAFVTPSSGRLLLDAVAEQPPQDITERIPKQLDLQAEWISGYWHWDFDLQDFVWVSGVWRRPPPGHQWISGYWKSIEEEWVWISGYWSKVLPQHTHYIGVAPPDPIDENMGPPPTSHYFWVPGHWFFLFDINEYRWVSGHWEELDPNWVYIPSHYTWSPGGYVFIPAYWDWVIEERGTAYSAVIIDPDYRYQIVFEPILILDSQEIVKRLFVRYPDYLSVVHHHYYYHQEYWHSFCCLPPWWTWDTWWGLTWHDHWGLWWWYTHPGYPQPLWLTKEISGILPTPLSELLAFFGHVHAPLIVTPNGVVRRNRFLSALNKVTEHYNPIVPDNKKVLKRVESLALPVSIDPTNRLRPLGRRLPIDPNAVRPNVRKPVINPKAMTRAHRLKEDLRPRAPSKPRIPSHKGSPIWRPERRPYDVTPPVRRPTWAPKSPRTHKSYHPESRKKSSKHVREKHWKPRPEWGHPPIQRPPIHRSKEQWQNRSRKSREKQGSSDQRKYNTPREQRVTPEDHRAPRRQKETHVEKRRDNKSVKEKRHYRSKSDQGRSSKAEKQRVKKLEKEKRHYRSKNDKD